ncbi:MAG: YfhO family protein, partial [Bacteroidota bacterium]
MVSWQKRKFPDLIAYLIFVIAGCIAFWDLISGTHMLSWDMIDGNYPFQHLQSLIERNGSIPLWDPYTNLGAPLNSKLGQWYPVRFLSSKIGEYTLYKLNIEFVLHIIIAGMGMFSLLKSRSLSLSAALFGGIAYMFSGFFIGNAQHMSWIISGAWLPWLLLLYSRIIQSPSIKQIPASIFVFFCFFTGGYPAFSIVTVYILFLGTIIYGIRLFLQKKQQNIQKFIGYILIIALGVTILSLAYLGSFFTMLSSVTRGDGVTIEAALFSSVQALHTITFIAPFSISFSEAGFWNGDLSMLNMYMGIATLILSLYSLRYIRNKKICYAWIAVIFFISLSLGDILPVRSFFYKYAPLWNTFRFPALFRLFYIFLLIGLATYSFEKITKNLRIQTLLKIGSILIIVYAITIAVSYFVSSDFPNYTYWHQFIKKLEFSHTILIQASVHIIVLIICVGIAYITYKKHTSISVRSIILLYLICDMVSTTVLQSAITVTTPIETYYTQSHVDVLPKQTAWPNIHEPAYDNSAKSLTIAPPLWRNLQVFHKKRSYNGYTSYVLKSTEELEQSIFYDSVKTYPILYIPHKIYSEKDTNIDYSSGHIAVLPDSLSRITYLSDSSSLTLISGTHNECLVSTYCSDTSYLVCMQNNYPGWHAKINNKPAEIISANFTAMAIVVPPGNSTIEFSYSPPYITEAYYLYQISLYILIILIIITGMPQATKRKKIAITILIILIFIGIEIRNTYSTAAPQSQKTTSYKDRTEETFFNLHEKKIRESDIQIKTDDITYFSQEM